ncbi:MAG: hypothetical protein IT478_09695 [Xanthomonadales bacterium]|nr:hypothetical protein [Xanthomonadales bacterium]
MRRLGLLESEHGIVPSLRLRGASCRWRWGLRVVSVSLCVFAVEPVAAGGACSVLVTSTDASSAGYIGVRFAWSDSTCAPRAAHMVYNDRVDPAGKRGGYLRWMDYRRSNATLRHCEGNSNAHPGWGYLTNHYASTATLSHNTLGTTELVFAGSHHAILRYRWRLSIGGPVDATVDWLFATGRDAPVWSVTYDASPAGPDVVDADSRSPYGDLKWDGGAGVNVDGVGWGDWYRMTTLQSPVTMNVGWDYSVPNTVPHVREWAVGVDAEMGAVQTQTMQQHDSGYGWFYPSWGTVDADGPMPVDWNWTYQLNQYEIPFTLSSKRMAWGMNYGAVGQNSYPAYGDAANLDGYPYQSYAVHMVLDEHSKSPTLTQVAQVERLQALGIVVTTGSLRLSGPAGVGRPDTVTWSPPGYNPTYATYEFHASGNALAATLTPTGGMVRNPVLLINGYTGGTPTVTFNATPAVADVDYFASVDAAGQKLWLTLHRDLNAPLTLTIGAVSAAIFADHFE